MQNYQEFLEKKNARRSWDGIENVNLSECLFDYQKAIVSWALRKGRAAIFADCGLGKGQPYGSKMDGLRLKN